MMCKCGKCNKELGIKKSKDGRVELSIKGYGVDTNIILNLKELIKELSSKTESAKEGK